MQKRFFALLLAAAFGLLACDLASLVSQFVPSEVQEAKQTVEAAAPTFAALATTVSQTLPAQPSPKQTVPAPKQASPTPGQAAGNPLDAITRAFRGAGGVKSFRVRMIIPATSNRPATTMNIAYALPDRYHMSGPEFEAILIGATMYIKVGGAWQKISSPEFKDLFNFSDPKKLERDLGVSTNIQLVGPEVLDGTPTLVYQYSTSLAGPPPSTYTSKVWIGVADNLPRKVESTSAAGVKTTIIYYDYNANIVINAPIP